jgi:hypothetical protein
LGGNVHFVPAFPDDHSAILAGLGDSSQRFPSSAAGSCIFGKDSTRLDRSHSENSRVADQFHVRLGRRDVSKGLAFLRSATIALATVGIVFPQTQILAEQKLPAKPVIRTVAANTILDVSLSKDGKFSGRAVTQNGNPVEGASVVMTQGNKEVAKSVTDRNGQFRMSSLTAGVYQVKSGNTEGMYRVWSEKSAPPSAKPYGLMVLGENGARGQVGCYDDYGACMLCTVATVGLATLGVGIATLILASSANSNANDAKDIAQHTHDELVAKGIISP